MAISREAAGVFDGKNMTLYTYCHQKPMILVDPDGLSTIYIEIYRHTVTDSSTIGILTLNYKNYGVTLELPYNNNLNDISSIPAGDYFGKFYKSPKHGDTIEIIVPGREKILFHIGNKPKDTIGCVLIGEKTKENEQSYIINSTKQFKEFQKTINAIKQIDKRLGEPTDIIIKVIDAT